MNQASHRRDQLVLLGLLLALAVLFRGGLWHADRWHNPDEGLWQASAAYLHESDVGFAEVLPYAGNRPLHFAVYALSDTLFGHYEQLAVDVLHSLLVGLCGAFLAFLSASLLGVRRTWVQLLVGAVYVLHSYTLYEGEASNSEHLANVFLVGFFYVWVEGARRGRRRTRCLSFLLLGLAFITKQQLAPLVLCAPAFWWLAAPRRSWRDFLWEMVGAGCAFFVPLLMVQVWIVRPESGVEMAGTGLAYALGLEGDVARNLLKAYQRVYMHVSPVPVMLIGVVAALSTTVAAPLFRLSAGTGRDLRGVRLASVVLVLTLLATTLGFHLYSHYFLLCLPFAVLVTAGVVKLACERALPAGWVATILLVTLLLCFPPHVLSLKRTDIRSEVLAGLWVRQNTQPEDRVFVWGWGPLVYLYAQRVPSTRFTSCSMVVLDLDIPSQPAYDPRRLQVLLDDLKRDPPQLIVIPVHMNWAFDRSRYELARVPPFEEYLLESYVKFAMVHDHLIYRRRGD